MSHEWSIGDRIANRWQIHRIFRGGMGIVYIVDDRELQTVLAAKTFLDEVFEQNPLIADRFRREALTWINLDSHPNVARALMIEVIRNKPFLFLEYVGGGHLGDWIARHQSKPDLRKVMQLAIQFCDGMIHAFTRGVVAHRDIKPENCLITRDEVLKITDFGIAKIFDPNSGGEKRKHPPNHWFPSAKQALQRIFRGDRPSVVEPSPVPQSPMLGFGRAPSLTLPGATMGTCTHMAPEQFLGERIDVRSDVYSFGILLYEMTTGRLPFVADTWDEYEALHRWKKPSAIVGQAAAINTIVQVCLQKDPARRYQNFQSLRLDLCQLYSFETSEPIPEQVIAFETGATQWAGKAADLHELGCHEDALLACDKALSLDPRNYLAWNNKGNVLCDLGRTQESIDCFNTAISIKPDFANAWANKGVALVDREMYEEAICAFDRALLIDSRNAKTWNSKGAAMSMVGLHELALTCFDKAISLNPDHWSPWSNKGKAYLELGKYEEAVHCYDQSLALNPKNDRAWNFRGCAASKMGMFEEALLSFDRSLTISSTEFFTWSLKGEVLARMQRHEDAIFCFDRALELNPNCGVTWNDKALAHTVLQNFEKALDCFENVNDRLRA